MEKQVKKIELKVEDGGMKWKEAMRWIRSSLSTGQVPDSTFCKKT